jgi:beta-glucosidase
VSWTIDRDDVGFYDNRSRFIVENGRINVYVGNASSQSDNRQSFTVTGGRRVKAAKRGGGR